MSPQFRKFAFHFFRDCYERELSPEVAAVLFESALHEAAASPGHQKQARPMTFSDDPRANEDIDRLISPALMGTTSQAVTEGVRYGLPSGLATAGGGILGSLLGQGLGMLAGQQVGGNSGALMGQLAGSMAGAGVGAFAGSKLLPGKPGRRRAEPADIDRFSPGLAAALDITPIPAGRGYMRAFREPGRVRGHLGDIGTSLVPALTAGLGGLLGAGIAKSTGGSVGDGIWVGGLSGAGLGQLAGVPLITYLRAKRLKEEREADERKGQAKEAAAQQRLSLAQRLMGGPLLPRPTPAGQPANLTYDPNPLVIRDERGARAAVSQALMGGPLLSRPTPAPARRTQTPQAVQQPVDLSKAKPHYGAAISDQAAKAPNKASDRNFLQRTGMVAAQQKRDAASANTQPPTMAKSGAAGTPTKPIIPSSWYSALMAAGETGPEPISPTALELNPPTGGRINTSDAVRYASKPVGRGRAATSLDIRHAGRPEPHVTTSKMKRRTGPATPATGTTPVRMADPSNSAGATSDIQNSVLNNPGMEEFIKELTRSSMMGKSGSTQKIDRRSPSPTPVAHPVSDKLKPHTLAALNLSKRTVDDFNTKATAITPSGFSTWRSDKASDFNDAWVRTSKLLTGTSGGMRQPQWLRNMVTSAWFAPTQSVKRQQADLRSDMGISEDQFKGLVNIPIMQGFLADRHNKALRKSNLEKSGSAQKASRRSQPTQQWGDLYGPIETLIDNLLRFPIRAHR